MTLKIPNIQEISFSFLLMTVQPSDKLQAIRSIPGFDSWVQKQLEQTPIHTKSSGAKAGGAQVPS